MSEVGKVQNTKQQTEKINLKGAKLRKDKKTTMVEY
jgi:hypothetical protein